MHAQLLYNNKYFDGRNEKVKTFFTFLQHSKIIALKLSRKAKELLLLFIILTTLNIYDFDGNSFLLQNNFLSFFAPQYATFF